MHAGKLELSNCYTKAAETFENFGASGSASGRRQRTVTAGGSNNEKEVLSEEEPEEFSSAPDDSESDMEITPRTMINEHIEQRRQKKFLKQRNIKQKVIALLRRFKPDEVSNWGRGGGIRLFSESRRGDRLKNK